ncbi:MAG: S-adenosyl-l-methionine hydroxide adenosyltransferase family protein [Promethearchaeota archaeon]
MKDLNNKIIALISDFGPKGQHYVASMKGVILKINPKVKIIDISHNISSFSIIEASYLIKSTYKYFPKNSVFLIVVDPGVGSAREIIAIETESHYYFVGPNNGIFHNSLESDNINKCVKIENDEYFHKPVSSTFHGRDIMAPISAYITKGISLEKLGTRLDLKDLVKYPMEYKERGDNKISCSIQYIDNFGNIITNIKGEMLSLVEGKILIIKRKKGENQGKFVRYFEGVPKNSLLFLIGSSGFLEISINQGNASKYLDLKVGDIIEIII